MPDEKKDNTKQQQRQHTQRRRPERQEDEFEEQVLEIRRVARVVAGGKRFSFRATVALGDRKGTIGIGTGKGLDVAESIRKAKIDAKKHIQTVTLKEDRTIPYDVEAKYGAARVRLKPVPENHGLIAGGAARVVLELAGVKDISAKILGGTNNKLNNAMATIAALSTFTGHK